MHLARSKTQFFEPSWKMVLSNKAILPILWELFPRHPYLLKASYYPHEFEGQPVVRKPLLSREGANVAIRSAGGIFETSGQYGAEGYIFQEFSPLPAFDGRHAVIGSWVIGGKSCGIGIREDASLVTKNTSWFLPHVFRS